MEGRADRVCGCLPAWMRVVDYAQAAGHILALGLMGGPKVAAAGSVAG